MSNSTLSNVKSNSKDENFEYNDEFIVPTFGFLNNGSICYFNSLLQNILNCKHIMHFLVNEQVPKNEIQIFFKNKFINFCNLYNEENNDIFKKETSTFSLELLKILLKKYRRSINEQQSSSEFFLYLVEELGIEHFFKIRHQINVYCGNCKNVSSKIDECLHFEMFCTDKDNKVDIDDFMYSVDVLEDYKCEKCKKVSKALYEKKAENISKYFVILLNKYYNKVQIEYPNTFEIIVKNIQEPNQPNNSNSYIDNDNYIPKKCSWENIGQIEHSGHLSSGHYTALCKRMDSLFLFDDMRVQLLSSNETKNILKPSKNTYMIFYEKK